MRLLLLIHGANMGGAERQLLYLARELDRRRFEPHVLTFRSGGPLEEPLRAAGVALHTAGKRRRSDLIGFGIRLARQVRRLRPDVIYSFTDFPNVTSAILKPLVPEARLIWGIRASNLDLTVRSASWRLFFQLSRRLARAPDLIICNSKSGRDHHHAQGYPAERMVVLPNGIDTDRFVPDPDSGRRVRQELGLAPDAFVAGLVARLDPMKDHGTFLRAAALLSRQHRNVRFLCVGEGFPEYAAALRQEAVRQGVSEQVLWTGHRRDIRAVLNALDVFTLSSAYGEGFSNSLGEAMACAIPCVATDVGDSAWVLGSEGRIVPPGDPERLAAAWADMLNLGKAGRAALGQRGRARVLSEFPLRKMVSRTEACIERTLARPMS